MPPGEEEISPLLAKPRAAKRVELRPGRWDRYSYTATSLELAPALKTLLISQLLLHIEGICQSRRSIPRWQVSQAVQQGRVTKPGMEEELGGGSRQPIHQQAGMAEGWIAQLCPACSGRGGIHAQAAPSSCTPPPWRDKLGGKVSHLSLFSQCRPTEHKPV